MSHYAAAYGHQPTWMNPQPTGIKVYRAGGGGGGNGGSMKLPQGSQWWWWHVVIGCLVALNFIMLIATLIIASLTFNQVK